MATALYDEYCHIRIKRLGEGFFFLDDGVQSLLAKDDSYQIVSKITNLIKKEPYFYSLPRTDLHCEGIDIDSSNMYVLQFIRLIKYLRKIIYVFSVQALLSGVIFPQMSLNRNQLIVQILHGQKSEQL